VRKQTLTLWAVTGEDGHIAFDHLVRHPLLYESEVFAWNRKRKLEQVERVTVTIEPMKPAKGKEQEVTDPITPPAQAGGQSAGNPRAIRGQSEEGRKMHCIEAVLVENETLRKIVSDCIEQGTDGHSHPACSLEFLSYAPREVAAVRRQRDDARAEVDRLRAIFDCSSHSFRADWSLGREMDNKEQKP
jgi:hypothetical protein